MTLPRRWSVLANHARFASSSFESSGLPLGICSVTGALPSIADGRGSVARAKGSCSDGSEVALWGGGLCLDGPDGGAAIESEVASSCEGVVLGWRWVPLW